MFEDEELHFAAAEGELERVRELLEAGHDVNAFDDLARTPLHYAAENEHLDVMRLLLEHGADVNAHQEEQIGDTPLAKVAAKCSFEVAQLLIEAGADPSIRGWMQLNALDRARKREKAEGRRVYELLLRARR